MKAEDWFAVAVRVVGIIVLLLGLGLLLDAFLLRLGYWFPTPDSTPGYYWIYGGAEVAVGLYLIRGARFVIRFAYPTTDKEETDREDG